MFHCTIIAIEIVMFTATVLVPLSCVSPLSVAGFGFGFGFGLPFLLLLCLCQLDMNKCAMTRLAVNQPICSAWFSLACLVGAM